MSRIFENLPLKALEDILKSVGDDQAVIKTLIEELSHRKDPASLRLRIEANKKLAILPKEVASAHRTQGKTHTHNSIKKSNHKSAHCPECKTAYVPEKILMDYKFMHCENPNCNRIHLKINLNDNSSDSYYYENPDKDGIICIDFGTSSIRASYASHDGADNQPIPIGAILGANEDYYLDSKIFISDKKAPKVFLSQWADLESLKITTPPFLFSASPKTWITSEEFSSAYSPITETSTLSRKDLLSLLLSLAIKGIKLELNLTTEELLNYEVRISHPVWESVDWINKKICMEAILHDAIFLSDEIEQGLSFEEIEGLLSIISPPTQIYSSIDVVEPIAAAVELFKNKAGYRQICAVIDIGAGTTDLGLFSSITPDSQSYLNGDGIPIKKLFKSMVRPISIHKAGDFIDEILTNIYCSKIPNKLNGGQLKSIQQQMRNRKPALFEDDEIYIGDVRITLQELVKHYDIVNFVDEISRAFTNLILSAGDEIEKQYNLNVNYIRAVDLIFSGGGHQINFIRNSMPKDVALTKQKIKIQIQDIDSLAELSLIDYARLAASLGGSCSSSLWPSVNPSAKTYGALDAKFNRSPFPSRI